MRMSHVYDAKQTSHVYVYVKCKMTLVYEAKHTTYSLNGRVVRRPVIDKTIMSPYNCKGYVLLNVRKSGETHFKWRRQGLCFSS